MGHFLNLQLKVEKRKEIVRNNSKKNKKKIK